MFHLPLNPIAHVQKPQRSHRYVCVFEHALANPDSARNIKVFNVDYTRNYESVGFILYDRKSNDSESAFSGNYLYYKIVL